MDGLRLEAEYVLPNTPIADIRLIAPHTLCLYSHALAVRAYCGKNGQYRDFVLSRLQGEPGMLDASENTHELDEDWSTEIPVIIAPDGRLSAAQKAIIGTDFDVVDCQLVVTSSRKLVKYVLQCYQSDH